MRVIEVLKHFPVVPNHMAVFFGTSVALTVAWAFQVSTARKRPPSSFDLDQAVHHRGMRDSHTPHGERLGGMTRK